ncbi:hypothetical protein [Nocardia sp. NPDC051750]|uniref:hypothetical protein n=1 Tax=Nocardia sp. NPDC051750 TaxID=3364325 RepID=UPI0037B1A090
MTTFLDYTVELLIDPDDPQTNDEDRIGVGFNYNGITSLVFLAAGHRRGHTYDPATHTLVSTHVMECGAWYPAHLHTSDRDQISYARDRLAAWYSAPGNGEDMPASVRAEIVSHLGDLEHYLAGGVWEIEIEPFGGAPILRVGNYPTPNAASAAIAGGQVWDLVGSNPDTDDDLIDCDLTVNRVALHRDTATAH